MPRAAKARPPSRSVTPDKWQQGHAASGAACTTCRTEMTRLPVLLWVLLVSCTACQRYRLHMLSRAELLQPLGDAEAARRCAAVA